MPLNPFTTLRHRNFRLFWFGQTLSLIGTWMQTMAQGWMALQLSNSALLVGLVAAASSLPILLFSFHAGVVVDRVDKLRTVRVCQTLLALQAGTLWWFTASGHITISWLIVLAATNGLISSLEIPARQSLVIDLVGRDELAGAIALNSSGFNLARVVGPAIGAVVIARAGLAACFGVNAASYITVLIGLFMIRLPRMLPPTTRFAPMEGIREGLRFMRDTPSVYALTKVVTVYSVLGISYLTLMPVVARDVLHLGAGGYGLLLACV
jgi:MFS family permease